MTRRDLHNGRDNSLDRAACVVAPVLSRCTAMYSDARIGRRLFTDNELRVLHSAVTLILRSCQSATRENLMNFSWRASGQIEPGAITTNQIARGMYDSVLNGTAMYTDAGFGARRSHLPHSAHDDQEKRLSLPSGSST